MRLLVFCLVAAAVAVVPAAGWEPYRPSQPWTIKRLRQVIRDDVYTVFPVPEPQPGYSNLYRPPQVRLPISSPYSMIRYGVPPGAVPVPRTDDHPLAPVLPEPRLGEPPPPPLDKPMARPTAQPTTLPDPAPRFLPKKMAD